MDYDPTNVSTLQNFAVCPMCCVLKSCRGDIMSHSCHIMSLSLSLSLSYASKCILLLYKKSVSEIKTFSSKKSELIFSPRGLNNHIITSHYKPYSKTSLHIQQKHSCKGSCFTWVLSDISAVSSLWAWWVCPLLADQYTRSNSVNYLMFYKTRIW